MSAVAAEKHRVQRSPTGALAALVGGCAVVGASMLPVVGWSPLAPVLAVAGALTAVFMLRRPLVPVYLLVMFLMLPRGLLPGAVVSAGVLGLTVLGGAAWVSSCHREHREPDWDLARLLLVGYLLWTGTSLLWAPDLVLARQSLVQLTIVTIMVFLLADQVRTRAELDRLMDVLAASGWLLLVCGAVTLMTEGYRSGERLQILDMNENVLGVLLILATPGVLWRAFWATGTRRPWWMAQGFAYLSASMALIALSGSRGSLLAFVLLVATLMLTRATRPWGATAAILGVVAFVTAPILFATVISRIEGTVPDAAPSRPVLWAAAVDAIGDRPLLGAGTGSGATTLPPYIERRVDADVVMDRTEFPAHNPVLEVGTDTGVPGMVLYAAAFLAAGAVLLTAGAEARRSGNESGRAYTAVVMCMSVALLAAWVKSGGFGHHQAPYLMLALWLLAARVGRGDTSERARPQLALRPVSS